VLLFERTEGIEGFTLAIAYCKKNKLYRPAINERIIKCMPCVFLPKLFRVERTSTTCTCFQPCSARRTDYVGEGTGFECQYLCLCDHGVLLNHHSGHQQVLPAVTLFTCIWDTPLPNLNLNIYYPFSRFLSVSPDICRNMYPTLGRHSLIAYFS
jgi:hypothetical protein